MTTNTDDRLQATDRPLRVHGRRLATLRRVRQSVDQAPSPSDRHSYLTGCSGVISDDDAATRPAPAGPTGPGESAPLATVTDHHLNELIEEATSAHLDGQLMQIEAIEVLSLAYTLRRERDESAGHLLGLGDIIGRHAARATLPPHDVLVEVLRTQIPGLTLLHARRVAGEITRAGIRGAR